MDWTFGEFIWATFIFFLWFAIIWMFIAIFADIFRRDISGWAKAGWIILIVLLPFIGILAYLITAPRTALRPRDEQSDSQPADQIAKAAHLQEQGKITAAEFDRIKAQALTR